MKRFFVGYVAGALSLFFGLAYWNSYQSAKAMERYRALVQAQVERMKRGQDHA